MTWILVEKRSLICERRNCLCFHLMIQKIKVYFSRISRLFLLLWGISRELRVWRIRKVKVTEMTQWTQNVSTLLNPQRQWVVALFNTYIHSFKYILEIKMNKMIYIEIFWIFNGSIMKLYLLENKFSRLHKLFLKFWTYKIHFHRKKKQKKNDSRLDKHYKNYNFKGIIDNNRRF